MADFLYIFDHGELKEVLAHTTYGEWVDGLKRYGPSIYIYIPKWGEHSSSSWYRKDLTPVYVKDIPAHYKAWELLINK